MKTMRMKGILSAVAAATLVMALLTGCATEKDQAKLEAQAKISKAEAQKIALGRVPGGTVKEGEIEKEKGKLIWSFDIATTNRTDITEVNVDALTGQVVSVEKETPKEEAKEKEKK